VIETLSLKYSDPSYWQVVTMLELLNEPATYLSDHLLQTTRQYWYDAYGAARYPWASQGSAGKSGLALAIHDGFQSFSTFNDFMPEPNWEDVFLDTHNYQIFNQDYQTWSYDTHIQVRTESYQCESFSGLTHDRASVPRRATTPRPRSGSSSGNGPSPRPTAHSGSMAAAMARAWMAPTLTRTTLAAVTASRATPAPSLSESEQRPQMPPRWLEDGADPAPSDYKTFMRKFYDVQTQVYEVSKHFFVRCVFCALHLVSRSGIPHTWNKADVAQNNGQGWIHWTWKTETSADWSYQTGLAQGWIPSDPTNHKYPLSSLCG
jgi:glucan 1,3-beta-glucosidase